jgi:hypothetical protein
MPQRFRASYSPEFRRQMVELAQSGRIPWVSASPATNQQASCAPTECTEAPSDTRGPEFRPVAKRGQSV